MRRAVALLAALVLHSARARAEMPCPEVADDPQTREEQAKELFREALTLEAADPEAALAQLRCADALVERPAVALRIGTIAERLGHLPEAIAAFERYLALAGESAPDRAPMRARIDELRQREAERTAPEPPPDPPLAGWALLISGAAIGLAGGGLLIAAQLHDDEVHDLPDGSPWAPDARATFEQAEAEQGVGIAALAIGGAAAATGLVLVVTSAEPAAADARVSLSARGARLSLAF